MSTTNPIRLIHDAIWSMLEANADLTTLVKSANRIKYDAATPPVARDVLTEGHVPELLLKPMGIRAHQEQTSSTSHMEIDWQLEVTTGDQRLATVLDIDWEIYRAMLHWETYLGAVVFESKRVATVNMLVGQKMTVDDSAGNRGIKGWRSIWGIRTILDFNTADILPTLGT